MATANSSKLDTLKAVEGLSAMLQNNQPLDAFWQCLSAGLDVAFSHTSCTVLSYDRTTNTLTRLYSSRPDIHKVGGRKRVTDSFWSRKVLDRGEVLIGSSKEDIKSYFSEYEVLLAQGWESILNIPVRHQGKTIGSINIMSGAEAYDVADLGVATIFAQLTVSAIEQAAGELQRLEGEEGSLEYV